ncbi:hypothetical protein GF420_07385 [candidate division GN15 bacterium]|nr:hypothetical protein [candidate division GN15 bacterium]
MPGGDRTGPLGRGPLSGRGAGYCRGNDAPGYVDRYGRRGYGGGYGRGRRHRYFATGMPGGGRGFGRGRYGYAADAPVSVSHHDERRYLEDEAERLRGALADVEARLAEFRPNRSNDE